MKQEHKKKAPAYAGGRSGAVERSRGSQLLPVLLAAAAFVWASGADSAPEVPRFMKGELELSGVSGAAFLRGDRLLLTGDGDNQVGVIENATARLRSGRISLRREEQLDTAPAAGKLKLSDLEDASWDGARDAYVIGSHAREPRGEAPEERYRLARFRFDAAGKLLEARQTGGLLQAIVNDVPFLADSVRRTPARTGLNVEGLAYHPDGFLLVGLRSPTITESTPRPHGGQEDAVVLRIRNLGALFREAGARADLGDVEKLDLHGQGIRGMCYDPALKACWLLSGLSAEPTHPVRSPWGLWLWDGKAEPREVRPPAELALDQPEAIAVTTVGDEPHLLLVDPARPRSRYALIPVARFGVPK